jgi:hypothetical protein
MKIESYSVNLIWDNYQPNKIYSDDLPIHVKKLLSQVINEIEVYYNERLNNE